MPQISSPYAGERVALATRHGKQRVIGRSLRHGLGAELLHLPDIDTDALGSFCGTHAHLLCCFSSNRQNTSRFFAEQRCNRCFIENTGIRQSASLHRAHFTF